MIKNIFYWIWSKLGPDVMVENILYEEYLYFQRCNFEDEKLDIIFFLIQISKNCIFNDQTKRIELKKNIAVFF